MYAMQRLQPKLKEMQNKYKDDREAQTKATMELYKTGGRESCGRLPTYDRTDAAVYYPLAGVCQF